MAGGLDSRLVEGATFDKSCSTKYLRSADDGMSHGVIIPL